MVIKVEIQGQGNKKTSHRKANFEQKSESEKDVWTNASFNDVFSDKLNAALAADVGCFDLLLFQSHCIKTKIDDKLQFILAE